MTRLLQTLESVGRILKNLHDFLKLSLADLLAQEVCHEIISVGVLLGLLRVVEQGFFTESEVFAWISGSWPRSLLLTVLWWWLGLPILSFERLAWRQVSRVIIGTDGVGGRRNLVSVSTLPLAVELFLSFRNHKLRLLQHATLLQQGSFRILKTLPMILHPFLEHLRLPTCSQIGILVFSRRLEQWSGWGLLWCYYWDGRGCYLTLGSLRWWGSWRDCWNRVRVKLLKLLRLRLRLRILILLGGSENCIRVLLRLVSIGLAWLDTDHGLFLVSLRSSSLRQVRWLLYLSLKRLNTFIFLLLAHRAQCSRPLRLIWNLRLRASLLLRRIWWKWSALLGFVDQKVNTVLLHLPAQTIVAGVIGRGAAVWNLEIGTVSAQSVALNHRTWTLISKVCRNGFSLLLRGQLRRLRKRDLVLLSDSGVNFLRKFVLF